MTISSALAEHVLNTTHDSDWAYASVVDNHPYLHSYHWIVIKTFCENPLQSFYSFCQNPHNTVYIDAMQKHFVTYSEFEPNMPTICVSNKSVCVVKLNSFCLVSIAIADLCHPYRLLLSYYCILYQFHNYVCTLFPQPTRSDLEYTSL